MAKTSRRGWLLAAAVPLLACGEPYPCEKNVEILEPMLLAGEREMRVTCASGTQLSLSTGIRMTGTYGTSSLTRTTIDLFANVENTEEAIGPLLYIDIPKELEDGTYSVEGPTPPIKITSVENLRGTITFQRTRDFPFVDQVDPPEGEVSNAVVVTLDIQGSYDFHNTCGKGTFALGPVTVNLRRTSEVGTCRTDVKWGGGH